MLCGTKALVLKEATGLSNPVLFGFYHFLIIMKLEKNLDKVMDDVNFVKNLYEIEIKIRFYPDSILVNSGLSDMDRSYCCYSCILFSLSSSLLYIFIDIIFIAKLTM